MEDITQMELENITKFKNVDIENATDQNSMILEVFFEGADLTELENNPSLTTSEWLDRTLTNRTRDWIDEQIEINFYRSQIFKFANLTSLYNEKQMKKMLDYYSTADTNFTIGHEILGGVKYWDIT